MQLRTKRDITIAFLDISKAFDNIGHDHIAKSLEEKGISKNVRTLINEFLSSNSIVIESQNKQS